MPDGLSEIALEESGSTKPLVNDPDFVLYVGDARTILPALPAASVDCCVTSPPYLGLRDYGMDGQIGLEASIAEYVAALVSLFAEVRRLLKPTGTFWLNLGDSYNAYNGNSGPGSSLDGPGKTRNTQRPRLSTGHGLQQKELKPKDLMLIPARVALALQADGWFLRSDIVWSKPNPMPESVTDRPTKSHEYIYLLTKSERYFYNADAIREPYNYDGRNILTREAGEFSHENHRNGKRNRWPGIGAGSHAARADLTAHGHDESEPMDINHAGRNKRSVWTIPTRPFAEAHFATFPIEIPRTCISAGSPAGGVVLDPFAGAGTTALAARCLGRRSIGVELNPEYAQLAARRLGQQSLLAEEVA